MRLTARQREVLYKMSLDHNLLQVGLVVCFEEDALAEDRISGRLVMFFLRNMLISEELDSKPGYRLYRINDWGRRALSDATFEPLYEIALETKRREAMANEAPQSRRRASKR